MKTLVNSILTYFLFVYPYIYPYIYPCINSFMFPGSKNNVDKMKKLSRGYDERYPVNGTNINMTEVYRFNIHWKQLEILRLLQNNGLSIYSKLNLIDHYDILSSSSSIYSCNLYAGGLMNEWDSE